MEYTEEIHRYLSREMTPEERRQFEKKLEGDRDLKAGVLRQKEVLDTLKEEGVIDLLEKLDKLRKKQISKDLGNKGLKSSKLFLLAASVVVLLGFATITLLNIDTSFRQNINRTAAEDLKGQRFELPESYGNLRKIVQRGTTFVMIRPPDSLVFQTNSEVNFLWKYENDIPLEITVVNSRDEVIHSGSSQNAKWYILQLNFPDGIYMYTISEGDILLHVGVFFIAGAR
jgi:hypothetical protein